MKICFLQYDLAGGGAERKVCTLANYFVSKGHKVSIGLFKNNVVMYDLYKDIDITYICKENRIYENRIEKFFYNILFKLLDFLMLFIKICNVNIFNKLYYKLNIKYNREIPLVSYIKQHSNYNFISMMPNTFGEVMTIVDKYNINNYVNSYIVMECNNPNLDTNKLFKYWREHYYPKATALVAQTFDSIKTFPKNVQEKCIVIPNPIRNDLIEPYIGERNKTIVTYCRLNEQKNLSLLINAFAKLSKEYKDYQLEIYGKGELKDSLLKQINDLNISDKAFIYDFDPNIHEKIKKSAMFILSSNYEGQPNGLMEAMAIGLPCISTDCDFGPRDMIIDHKNGLLVPCNDVDALCNAMKEFIKNQELANLCGINGIKIRELLSIDKIGNKWLDLIKEINDGK